jgi:membrane protein
MANRLDTIFNHIALRVDEFQQKYHPLAFIYAVIKKYSDDEAGHRAALLTYYGFLSLFPLLLVATSIADFVSQHNTHVRTKLLTYATSYFPVVGQQLQQNIHGSRSAGTALVVGIVFALYGARGIANAVRDALDDSWAVPRAKRSGFPASFFKSIALLFGVGLSLILTTALAGYATAVLGHSIIFRIVPIAINAALLYLICMYVFILGTSNRRPRRELRLGAIAAVVGMLILQTLGGYLITHQLHKTSGAYGQFSLVLAVMFWIYLIAQVFTYAIEINVVHAYSLWPRSLTGKHPTSADEKSAQLFPLK